MSRRSNLDRSQHPPDRRLGKIPLRIQLRTHGASSELATESPHVSRMAKMGDLGHVRLQAALRKGASERIPISRRRGLTCRPAVVATHAANKLEQATQAAMAVLAPAAQVEMANDNAPLGDPSWKVEPHDHVSPPQERVDPVEKNALNDPLLPAREGVPIRSGIQIQLDGSCVHDAGQLTGERRLA